MFELTFQRPGARFFELIKNLTDWDNSLLKWIYNFSVALILSDWK